MKRDLFYRDCFGRNCPTIVNDNKTRYEVHENNNWYEIKKIEPWYITDALEYEDEERNLFLWSKTPIFESKIQAVRYMLDNANRFI